MKKLQTILDNTQDFKDLLQILVVDDDEVDQMSIKRSLSKTSLSVQISTAMTGKEGLQMLQEKKFDCILLDFVLPDMNGLDLLHKIRGIGVLTPLLVVTSHGDEQIAAKAIQMGAADYIPKSFLTPDGIFHSVRNAIRLSKAEAQRKLTAEHLQATQSQLNLLVSNLPVAIWNLDKNGIVTFANGRVLEMIGLTPSLLAGHHFSKVFRNFPGIVERMQKALSGETVQAISEINSVYLQSLNIPMLDGAGNVTGVSGFTFDISDSVLNERELIRAKELAEQSVHVKEQFIANISHEIRTPMNGIIGLTNVLQKTLLDQEQKKYLKAIQTSADNLMVIINDLLDFSKMSAQNFILEQVDFCLRELIDDLVLLLQTRVEERGNVLKVDIDEHIPSFISGDPLRIRQIILNLIGNAIKFTENGEIILTVKVKDEQDENVKLEFTVEDTGIGIPEEKLSAIFESFNQGSNDTTRKYGGAGLGLTISKSLVELQGGTIVVRSKLHAGSAFSFVLTFKKQQATSSEIPPLAQKQEIEEPFELQLNILLAEDNQINQLLIQKVLKDWGMDVSTVEDGQQALELLNKEQFDIILMDMQMPVMDGYEAIRKIRSLDNAKAQLPIISLTAHAAASEIEKCLATGANAYVSKPFAPEELYQTIKRLVPTKGNQSNML